MEKLERVKKRATKGIIGQENLPYEKRKGELPLFSPKKRNRIQVVLKEMVIFCSARDSTKSNGLRLQQGRFRWAIRRNYEGA